MPAISSDSPDSLLPYFSLITSVSLIPNLKSTRPSQQYFGVRTPHTLILHHHSYPRFRRLETRLLVTSDTNTTPRIHRPHHNPTNPPGLHITPRRIRSRNPPSPPTLTPPHHPHSPEYLPHPSLLHTYPPHRRPLIYFPAPPYPPPLLPPLILAQRVPRHLRSRWDSVCRG